MARRRQARTVVLQLLYQKDLTSDVTTETTQDMLAELLPNDALREFAWQLYTGTLSARQKIDQDIQKVAQNWRVSRMSATDRNVIRMGTYEMCYLKTPPAVVIDECVEIAREYGLPQSGQFVNGILDKLKPGMDPVREEPVVEVQDVPAVAEEAAESASPI